MMLSLFGILTFIFAVQTLRMNRALQARSHRPQGPPTGHADACQVPAEAQPCTQRLRSGPAELQQIAF